MDIMEAIGRKLKSYATGYTQTSYLDKSLTPDEVEEFMRFVDPDTTTINDTPLKNIETWHPVCRLSLMYLIAQSLNSQGHL
jgi:hypothetical protein